MPIDSRNSCTRQRYPREHVTFRADRHLELEIFVARVRSIAAKVNIDPAAAQRRTARPQSNRVFRAQVRDALGAHHENRIPRQQAFIPIHVPREPVRELLDLLKESQRRLQRQPANAEIRRHHPLPADHLEKTQNVFALPEAIEKHGHRAEVHGMRAQPDQVRIDAGQLVHQNPHPLRFWRNLQPQQLLNRQAVGQIVSQRTEVIDAIRQRNNLLVELLRLTGFLDARMQEADLRLNPHDCLTVNFQHQPQNPVCRRVLRPHVQD